MLNADQKAFSLNDIERPLLIEFWATWCSPCVPAMSKLEDFQRIYASQLDIITVSTDSKSNLIRYIDNTRTSLKIAFDTTHHNIFNYQNIPHAVLIDKNGITKAITTPDKITADIINDLIAGKDIIIDEAKIEVATNLALSLIHI